MIKTTELRIKKKRLGAIVTAASPDIGPIEAQWSVLEQWLTASDKVIVNAKQKPQVNGNGLRYNSTNAENPSLISMLRNYVVQIPGSEVFAIAAPNVLINPDQSKIFDYIELNKMERTWCGHASENGQIKLFVMTAPILPYILQNIPDRLTLAGADWSHWLIEWMNKYMLKHKVFNADQFGLILKNEAPPPADLDEVIPDWINSEMPEIQSLTAPKPIKKKSKKA